MREKSPPEPGAVTNSMKLMAAGACRRGEPDEEKRPRFQIVINTYYNELKSYLRRKRWTNWLFAAGKN